MATIEQPTRGSLAKNTKLIEVIKALNSLINAEVREGAKGESPQLVYGENSTKLITTGGGGTAGGGLSDFQIIWADGTSNAITYAAVIENYNPTYTDWSIKLPVSNSVFTKFIEYDDGTTRFDGDSSTNQTYCRIPIIRNQIPVCHGGVFQAKYFLNDGVKAVMERDA